MGIKEDVIVILLPIFGESVKDMIDKFYWDEEPKELIKLAKAMIGGYYSPEIGEKLLKKITEKYHVGY